MLDCIYRNVPENPEWIGSFYERLVEYGEWNIPEFWQLHHALIEAAIASRQSEKIDRMLALSVVKIHLRVSGAIAAHFDKNDVFNISNLSYDEIHEFKERLDLAVSGVFSGEIIPESSFDLKNPLMAHSSSN